MDYELLFPSKYLKAVDLDGRDCTVMIERVVIDELVRRGGSREKKGVMHLKGTEKMVVLNRTNAETIVKLYGRDTSGWIGKRITLYPARVTFGRDTVDAIRVREQVPRKKGEQAPPPEPPAAAANDADDDAPPQFAGGEQ